MDIAGRRIGGGVPTYIVAEMSANHQRELKRAMALVDAAAEAGADAVKLQTFTPDTMTIASDKEHFRISGGLWNGRTLYELYQEAAMPWDWQPELTVHARQRGLQLFSTPFDETAVDFLETLDVPAYKIASFELTDHPLLGKVARTGKPVILSTGMASRDEIGAAVRVLRDHGAGAIALLKCTSAYPARPEEMNLRVLKRLAEEFGTPVGLSDHTLGDTVAITAVTLGAAILEKHLTLARKDGGLDAAFSLEPDEFSRMVRAIRTTEAALGSGEIQTAPGESANRIFRRSIFVVQDTHAGEPFTPDNIRVIRPGHGLAPAHFDEILGKRAVADISRGTPLNWDLIAL
ncbi:MAG: pseudaminic acid synthase [Candidatus Hydrogenedentes bacterium]|nr:pseudaminic acid synthase [Candidatus Hydrogenedentota bacterium]